MKPIAPLVLALPAMALAQTQVVKPPIAEYWMSVETAAGTTVPGMGATAASLMGPQAQGGRRMLLQLGSQRAPAGEPRGAHEIPPGLNMGPQLPLLGPRRERAERTPRGESREDDPGTPKGRMLVYWGCGDEARPGQPVVVDFSRAAQGQVVPLASARRATTATGPAPGRHRSYGEWPNEEDAKPVPQAASLRGAHAVKANYAPEIRFNLDHDFLERVDLSAQGNRLRWNRVAAATGYFAMLMGARDDHELVLWTSSEVQESGSALMDYVPPAEVARLVREKVVLAPQVSECAVPAEVLKKAGTPLVSFIAYGPESNFAHPPRPADPKVPWQPDWTVKVRFKSTASLLMGDEGGGREERTGAREAPRQEHEARPAAPDPLQEGVRVLRGIFGR